MLDFEGLDECTLESCVDNDGGLEYLKLELAGLLEHLGSKLELSDIENTESSARELSVSKVFVKSSS